MCGRFTLRTKPQDVASEFDADVPIFVPRYNIAPSADIPVIRKQDGDSVRSGALLTWGLIPSWSHENKAVGNAKAETVATKPWFRDSFHKRRCLIPADGFYEWLHQKGRKQPYYYQVDGGQLFAFAGLWDSWQGVETCALITTDANSLVQQIHPRMPVILTRESYDLWLDARSSREELLGVLHPFPTQRMEGFPVSMRVNKANHEGPELIEPIPLLN